MKKRIVSLIIALTMAFCLLVPSAAAAEETGAGEALYNKLETVIDLIEKYGAYYDGEDLIKEFFINEFNKNPEYFEYVADQILASQDPYSGYFTAEQYEQAYTLTETFGGIGVGIRPSEKGFMIVSVSEGSPAQLAGIIPGDVLTHVDGKSLDLVTQDELTEMIRGEVGSSVSLSVMRGGASYTYTVQRVSIAVSNVEYTQLEEGIAYIKLSSFGGLDDYFDFFAALSSLPKQQTKSLILDLRNNLGGSMEMALQMLNDIIVEADVPMIGIKQSEILGGLQVEYSVGKGFPLNKIVILVNEYSASASEIVAGSLQDLGYAELVGTSTFGKAAGQYHFTLEDGSYVVLTGLSLILPSGKSYSEVGLTPDYYVENEIIDYPMPELTDLDASAPVYVGERSARARAVNERLVLLGYLVKADMDLFDSGSLIALNTFQTAYGYQRTTHATIEAISQLENRIEGLAESKVIYDHQFDKAVEIAREGLKEDLPYYLDQFGYPVAK